MINKNKLVVKSNDLIGAFTNMTLNESKIVAYLISKIKPDDTKFLTQEITVKELNDLLGIEGTKTYTYMKMYSDSLLRKKVSIKYANGNWKDLVWFDEANYYNNESILSLCFSSKLESQLLELKSNYTKYILKNICLLNSSHSMRIYELLKQYEKLGYRIIELIELKILLGIEGKYIRYNDFKKDVIFPSQKELLKTDISFTFEEIKRGKRVDAIKFNIFKNGTHASQIEDAQIDAASESPSPDVQNLKNEIEKTVNGKIGAKGLKNLVDSVPLDTIKEYLTNWPKFTPGENPIGYFIKACIDRYTIPETINNKPIQATNYEQREYDDEFYDSLYHKFD